jgi:hypothetical protein
VVTLTDRSVAATLIDAVAEGLVVAGPTFADASIAAVVAEVKGAAADNHADAAQPQLARLPNVTAGSPPSIITTKDEADDTVALWRLIVVAAAARVRNVEAAASVVLGGPSAYSLHGLESAAADAGSASLLADAVTVAAVQGTLAALAVPRTMLPATVTARIPDTLRSFRSAADEALRQLEKSSTPATAAPSVGATAASQPATPAGTRAVPLAEAPAVARIVAHCRRLLQVRAEECGLVVLGNVV